MDENLISKKELLELTGISYGALYRWKRKNLIPEEWFIKKSSFTGQETFFKRNEIIERINKIKSMKEDLSLEDLAEVFSPDMSKFTITIKELKSKNIISDYVLDFCLNYLGYKDILNFNDLLYFYIIETSLRNGGINIEEGKIILDLLVDNYNKVSKGPVSLIFFRKLGIGSCMLINSSSEYYFENDLKIVVSIKISTLIEELRLKLG